MCLAIFWEYCEHFKSLVLYETVLYLVNYSTATFSKNLNMKLFCRTWMRYENMALEQSSDCHQYIVKIHGSH